MFDGQISAGIAHLPTNTRQLQCSEKQASRYEPRHEETGFLHICENKDADQLRGSQKLISAFVFAK